MKINQYSQSTKIYLEQIENHIDKGQGYSILRKHLLKQINHCHSQNIQADESLVPAVLQKLSYSLLSEDHQRVQRTIDIIQDLIKYAENVVCPALNNSDFCLTLSVCLQHKKIITFSKQMIMKNKERLGSILIFLFKKYQHDPLRYVHIVTTYKNLKQKQCYFPKDTYLIIPKLNEFIEKKPQKQQQKIGITFDSIIFFVDNCEKKFNENKNQCANTQFVRGLKVKAKMLYDLSQSQGSIQLNQQQKQQAKVLYKKLRTMLKQLQKINQANIKLKKIKEQKQFIANKIQNLTPKKQQISPIKSNNSEKQKSSSQKQKNQINLLTIENFSQQSKKQKIQIEDEFGQYQQNHNTQKEISSGKKSSVKETPKKLKKPPVQQFFQKPIVQNYNLLDNQEKQTNLISKISNEKSLTNKQQLLDEELLQINIAEKSIHSYKSCESGKNIKSQEEKSNHSDFQFNNANNFSKFEMINQIVNQNKYGMIPNDLNLTPSSDSNSINQQNGIKFEENKFYLFQNNQTKYDSFTPKKIKSSKESQQKYNQESLPKSAKVLSQTEKVQLEPNQNFGVLLDTKIVKAYDYSNIEIVDSPSKFSQQSQQAQIKIQKSPKTKDENDFTQYVTTNSDKKIKLENNDIDDLLI